MRRLLQPWLAMATGLAFGLMACGPTNQEYASLAAGGQAFNTALAGLSQTATETRANRSAAQMLRRPSPDRAARATEIDTTRAEDLKFAAQMALLRQSSRQFAAYFDALGDLATSDAPTQVSDSVKGLGTELGKTAALLGQVVPAAAPDIAAALGRIVVAESIRGTLRQALERDREALIAAARYQAAALQWLAGEVQRDEATVRELDFNRAVRGAYINATPGSDGERAGWSRRYSASLVPAPVNIAVTEARARGNEFVEVVDAVLQDRLTPARAADFARRMQALAELIAKLGAI